MSTQALNAKTIDQISDAMGQIEIQLKDKKLTGNDRDLLEAALTNLQDQQDAIINDSLTAMIDKVNASNKDLQALITKMQAASAKISAFSATIQKIMNVTSILVEITLKAMTAGLI